MDKDKKPAGFVGSKNRFVLKPLMQGIAVLLILVGLGVVISVVQYNNHECCSPITITEDLDMEQHYILNFPLSYFVHFTMEKKATNVVIEMVPAGMLIQDRHYSRLSFSTNVAVGVGKECSVSISDGTNTMTVTLTGAEISGYTTTNAFDLDVSFESFILSYSQDAKGSAKKGFVTIIYWYKENV